MMYGQRDKPGAHKYQIISAEGLILITVSSKKLCNQLLRKNPGCTARMVDANT